MLESLFQRTTPIRVQSDNEFLHAHKDHEFDQIFPVAISKLSACHWSPANVCRTAAQMLASEPGAKVLDIGCGPGKFCIIGATTTQGHFTGVEQRAKLVRVAKNVIEKNHIPRVDIVHGNIQDMNFRDFDAFYLFNPFEENVLPSLRIDYEVELKARLYTDYTAHVQQQLLRMPLDTRVVTYCGECLEIPACYVCVKTAFTNQLKLWVKKHPSLDYAYEAAHADNENGVPARAGGMVYA
ncbi:class I SAM-dependent methyltransferase [Prosthecobacter sp.]|uniref:class I SAM-dependent methyltransferase n=1 Tax=Prosthecobacter sp. TaxID=1965333 RepID=UPI0037836812